MKLQTYSDGGARGNPGPAAIGVVVCGENGEVIEKQGFVIGETTNNQAEYKALLAALAAAKALGGQELVCYLDSELVVRQLQGIYKIKEPSLQPLAMEVLKLVKDFQSVEFAHIPRAKNKLADSLVNEALDQAGF